MGDPLPQPLTREQLVELARIIWRRAVAHTERRLAGSAFSAAPPEPNLSSVRQIARAALVADPERFQFRRGHAADGTVHDLPAEQFDPRDCEPLVAWRDPAEGVLYVVDGHHRLAWAERDGVARLPVRMLDCATAEEARAWGARANAAQDAAGATAFALVGQRPERAMATHPATFSAPGPPPRPGLAWKDETHRWVNPHTGEEHEHAPGGAAASAVHYHGPVPPAAGWTHVAVGPDGTHVWRAPPKRPGVVGRLLGRPKPAAAPDPTQAGHTAAHTLEARMAANAEYRGAKKKVEERNAPAYRQLAAQSGKSVAEVRAAAAAKAQAFADSQDVYVRVPDQVLPLILGGGRFKSTHETGTGGGLTDRRLRLDVEAKGMGVGPDEPDETRPLSAYLGAPDFASVGRERGVADYGPVVVKLKPRVRDRSTVTFGDSLEQIQNGYAVASPLARIDPDTVNPRELLHDPKVLDGHADYHRQKGFAEVQVHGGLSTADVEEVAFPADPAPDTKAALAARGIRWRVYGTHGPTGGAFAAAVHPDDVATFAARAEGERWRGPSGRWFTKKRGRVVPAKGPEGGAPGAGGPSAGVPPGPTLPHEAEIRALVEGNDYAGAEGHVMRRLTTADYQKLKEKYGIVPGQTPRDLVRAMAPGIADVIAASPGAAAALAAVRAALARHQSAGREAKREAVRAALAAALKPPAPQKLDAAYDPAAHGGSVGSYPRGYKVIPPAQLEAAKAVYDPATAFVEGVTAGIDGAKVAFGTDARGRAWASERGMRGHTRAPEGADYVAVLGGVPEADDAAGRRREIETAVHELGHVVEFHKPAVRELAKQFLDHRCGDEPVKKLTDLFPAANYGDDEVGRRDGFAKVFGADAYYVGKHYGSGSTEVVSMGLEQLYRDPAKFAEKDPEYFAFVCHVLTM